VPTTNLGAKAPTTNLGAKAPTNVSSTLFFNKLYKSFLNQLFDDN